MAEDNFDPNKMAAEIVVKATEQAISAAAEPLRTRMRRLLQSISDAYAPFLEKTFVRVSTIRTFLKPSESVDLIEHYVPVGLTDKFSDFHVDGVIEEISSGGRFVISGLAGRGKSVLMKYIALAMYHAPKGRIPLFLELRHLNNLTSKNILQLLHSLYKGESNVSFNDFLDVLGKGYFALILDGFDEIAPQDREIIERQIIDISFNYEKVAVVVSGRPYERFSTWERYKVLHLKPMTYNQTRALIEKSTYDIDVKKTFLKRLTKEFFSAHESFLNTPLLAIMLMLTFEEYAEIPVSLHEFYRNAFDTLLRRHDAMKAQFLRQTHSGCTAEEFKRIFASFCLLTYSKSVFTFHRDEILEYIELAIKQQRCRYKKEKLLDDFIESICILQEEGFEISFVHRSFQEYFCALFISGGQAGLVKKYLDSGKFRIQDDVIPMLYGMVPDRVESEWANGVVADICGSFGKNDEDADWKLSIAMYPKIEIMISHDGLGPIALEDTELARNVNILRRMYPAHFISSADPAKSDPDSYVKKWNIAVLKELESLEDAGDVQLAGFKMARKKSEQASSSDNSKALFPIQLNASHVGLIRNIYGDMFSRYLHSIRAIQKDQKLRLKGSDSFLKEVFANM